MLDVLCIILYTYIYKKKKSIRAPIPWNLREWGALQAEASLSFHEIRAENFRGYRSVRPRHKITGGIVMYFGFVVPTARGCNLLAKF